MTADVPSTPPLVSVLVPAHNHSRYIEACLNSVVEDGYPNIELIILDDGSSDDTYAKAENWLRENGELFSKTLLLRQRNQGVVKTLNAMLRVFTGQYFALLASDDVLLKNGIQARLRALEKDGKALAIFADAVGVDEQGRKVCESIVTDKFRASRRALANPLTRPFELILNWCVPGPVFLADRQVLETIGFYNENFYIEDRDYYLRLILNGALTFTTAKVAGYRMHSYSLTGTRERQLKIGLEVLRIERENLKTYFGMKRVALWSICAGNFANLQSFRLSKNFLAVFITFIARAFSMTLKLFFRILAQATEVRVE